MSKTLPTFFLFACCLLMLSACYTPRYAYSPSAVNVPAFTQKNDSKIGLNYSTNLGNKQKGTGLVRQNSGAGFDGQLAHAISNHLALQFNYSYRKELNDGNFDTGRRDSVLINYKRNLSELGVGYFADISGSNRAFFQIFGGVGVGKFRFTDNGRNASNVFHSNFHNTSITKFYVQPSIYVINKKQTFTASFASRFSIIKYHNIVTDYSAVDLDNYKLDSLAYSPHVFWEPAMIYSFGLQKVPGLRLEFQTGFAILSSQRFIDYRSFNFSAGLLFDLPKLLQKKPVRSKGSSKKSEND